MNAQTPIPPYMAEEIAPTSEAAREYIARQLAVLVRREAALDLVPRYPSGLPNVSRRADAFREAALTVVEYIREFPFCDDDWDSLDYAADQLYWAAANTRYTGDTFTAAQLGTPEQCIASARAYLAKVPS
jgi:hypothetical protein